MGSPRPDIAVGDWIRIASLPAVVCHVHGEGHGYDCEAVYIDYRDRAINENVAWKDGQWQFAQDGPCGGYADNYPRLADFVAILRRGPRDFLARGSGACPRRS